MNSWKFKQK